jgi:hypothetical protein
MVTANQMIKLTRIELTLFFFLFCALALTFGGHGASVDENLIIQVLDSFVERGELTVTKMFQALPGPDEKYYSRYGFGFPLVLLPFYLLGSLLEAVAGKHDLFYRDPHFFMLLWGQVFFTAATGWVLYRVCRELGGSVKVAVALSLGLIFGTTFWPYSQALYRLTFSALMLLLVLRAGLVYLRSNRGGALVAIVLLEGFGLNVREDLAIAFLGIGLYLAARASWRGRLLLLSAFFLGAMLGFCLWLGHNYLRFGTVWIENYADLAFHESWLISMPAMLYGKKFGLLWYSPILLFFPLAFSACRKSGMVPLWILGLYIFMAYFCLYASSTFYHGGQCFGPRHMYFILPFVLLPLIPYFETASKRLWGAWWALVAVGMLFNAPGLYAHHGKYESFFDAPPFWDLLWTYPQHPYVLLWDELDFWWFRTLCLHPLSLWPLLFLALVALTAYCGFRLWQAVFQSTETGNSPHA